MKQYRAQSPRRRSIVALWVVLGAGCAVGRTVENAAGEPVSVTIETAAGGSGTVIEGATLTSGETLLLFAVVRDASGGIVPDLVASWSLVAGEGELTPAASSSFVAFRATRVGTVKVKAIVDGLPEAVSGAIEVASGPARRIAIRASALGTVGVPVSVTLAAVDDAGNDVASAAGDVRLTSSNPAALISMERVSLSSGTASPTVVLNEPGETFLGLSDVDTGLDDSAVHRLTFARAPLTSPALLMGNPDFGPVTTSVSSLRIFTLRNPPAADTITDIQSAGLTAPFTIESDTCLTTLDPGKQCTISVSFAPVVSGLATATLIVSYRDSTGAAQSVSHALWGLAEELRFHPFAVAPVMWFDAGRLVLGDGLPVTSWRHAGGPTPELTPASSTTPVFDADGLHGRPAVRFQGSTDALTTGLLEGGPIPRPYSLFFVGALESTCLAPAGDVCRILSANSGAFDALDFFVHDFAGTNSVDDTLRVQDDGRLLLWLNSNSFMSPEPEALTTAFVASPTPGYELWANGLVRYTQDRYGFGYDLDNLHLGWGPSGAEGHWGLIAEVLIIPGDLAAGGWFDDVRCYLDRKYDLQRDSCLGVWFDTSFGGDGKAKLVPTGNGTRAAFGLERVPGNSLVATGRATGPDGYFELVVSRFLESGEKDVFFGDDGVVRVDFGVAAEGAATKTLVDGAIVVAGTSQSSYVVVRLLADGAPDPGFATAGHYVDPGLEPTEAVGLAIDGQSRILVAGSVGVGGARDFFVDRLLPDGTLDASYGSGGRVRAGTPLDDVARALTVDARGRLVVAGSTGDNSDSVVTVARLQPTGLLDPTFGPGGSDLIDGIVSHPAPASAIAVARAVQMVAGDQLIIAGHVGNPSRWMVTRLQDDGSIDSTFGMVTAAMADASTAFDVFASPDGSIMAFGERGDLALIVGLDSGGAPNRRIGIDGTRHLDVSAGSDTAFAGIVDRAGRIVIGGSFAGDAVARILP